MQKGRISRGGRKEEARLIMQKGKIGWGKRNEDTRLKCRKARLVGVKEMKKPD